MTNSLKPFVLASLLVLFVLQACKQKPQPGTPTDKWHAGSARFAADESFQPIVEQEVYVFTSLNHQAKPTITYGSENKVVQLLLDDSVRMVMLTRDLDSNELKVLKTKLLVPEVTRFAIDAAVLIVNKGSADTLITVGEIKKMLNGNAKTDKNIVFDNPGSSLLRYFRTLSGNSDFKQKNIFALKTNKEVIKYVSTHPDAIGITDFSWLDDPDSDYADAVKNVKIMSVRDESSAKYPNQYFQPSQTSLDLKQYPLSRSLFIVNCTDRMGLGTGLAMFMTSDKGQRIILESGLLPDEIPGREITVKKSFN